MAKKNTRRDQKKREKQKKKRAEARKTRGSRAAPVQAAVVRETGIAGWESWPVSDCYLSENWSDQGARVHAAFVRENDEGRCAAAFFEVDLKTEGVTEVLSRGNVSYAAVQGEMARRSELSKKAMLVADPALVAKLVLTGVDYGRDQGLSPPKGLDEALRLFGDIDPEDAPESILVGTPPPPPAKKKSLFSVLFG